jgi:atypical dual specificity phosphatase
MSDNNVVDNKNEIDIELNEFTNENIDNIVNILIENPNKCVIKNKKKIIMTAFYIKTKKITPFEAMNILNVSIESDKIMFLKGYYCYIINKIRSNKKPVLKYGLIMLIGIPCSGKTTFSNKLLTTYGDSTIIHLNQDELGRKECEKLFLNNAKKINKTIILDRCNLSIDDRSEWITLYKQLSNRKVLGIYFNYSVNDCCIRMTERDNHTMNNTNLLKSINDKKNEPTLNENFNELKIVQDDMSLQIAYKIFNIYNTGLKKFVRTKHLINLGSVGRDDLLFTKNEIEEFLTNNNVVIEEKIDGANLGIFIEDNEIIIQNRSHFITPSYHPQFALIGDWLNTNQLDIRNIIKDNNWILYGEWLYAKHSINYTNLPNYFILFDIYDRDLDKFFSRSVVEEHIKNTNINLINKINEGIFKFEDIKKFENFAYTKSKYYDGLVEGVYLRIFDEENKYLKERAKIVRHNFLEDSDKHWTHNKLTLNKLNTKLINK